MINPKPNTKHCTFSAPKNKTDDIENIIRVLVVDDDPNDFYMVERLLGKCANTKFETSYVSSHQEAIIELKKNAAYDVALLDYYISGQSAKDVFHALDGRWGLPVIVFTGHADEQLEFEMLAAGAFDFLDKSMLSTESLTLSLNFAIRRYAVEERARREEAALRREFQNSEAENISKTEFLAFLSSEIKTPLNAIVGFSQAMKDEAMSDGIPDSFRRYTDTVFESSVHLNDLVEDLLDLSNVVADDFDVRSNRMKRFRTWIMDRQSTRVPSRIPSRRAIAS